MAPITLPSNRIGTPPWSGVLSARARGRDPARSNLPLELPTGPPIDRRSARLADADVDARHLSIVEPVEQDQVTPIVNDRDDRADAPGSR
jgi:hypothetical protein